LAILSEIFRDFPHSRQGNAGWVSAMR